MNKIDEIALRIAEQIEPRGRTYSPDHYKDVVKLVFAELSNDAAPVAICDTKNRIKWDGDDDAHRYSSAPNCIEVGTTLFTHPAPVIASEQRPFAWLWKTAEGGSFLNYRDEVPGKGWTRTELFTSPPNTADIEQRVAEAIAKFVSKGARELAEEYGQDDMGSLSFGSGHRGEVMFDRYNELMELNDEIRLGKWREYL